MNKNILHFSISISLARYVCGQNKKIKGTLALACLCKCVYIFELAWVGEKVQRLKVFPALSQERLSSQHPHNS